MRVMSSPVVQKPNQNAQFGAIMTPKGLYYAMRTTLPGVAGAASLGSYERNKLIFTAVFGLFALVASSANLKQKPPSKEELR